MMQAELCERIATTLKSGAPIHDHLGYEALAYLKLPGPDYLTALRALHATLKPELYVEIGTRRGQSLALALPETRCVAIDPFAQVDPRPKTMVANARSDDFFAIAYNRDKCRGFDLAFIDGDHSFEQVARDFHHLEDLAKPSSIICLHDVIPMDARTAQPKAETSFHTGDVWRLMRAIVASRPDLIAFTIACPPSGLGVVGRFSRVDGLVGNDRHPVTHEQVEEFATAPFPSTWDEQVKVLNIVPNTAGAILQAFAEKAA